MDDTCSQIRSLALLMQIYYLLQPMELIFNLAGIASMIAGSIDLGGGTK
jgi:hypothetical protein